MRFKWILLSLVLSLVVLLGIPLIFVNPPERQPTTGQLSIPPPAPSLSPKRVLPPDTVGLRVKVYVNKEKRLLELPIEEYLKGVVAAEMPAGFESEALKAQAVVARTYTIKKMRLFGGPGCSAHPEADVCTDPKLGQAWQGERELRKRWGLLGYWRYWRKVSLAVNATRGLIVVYNGQPIDAVYHAASGGKTEDAEYAWGRPVPYLRSVPSPYEAGRHYENVTVLIPASEIKRKLGITSLSAGVEAEVLHRSPSGRVLAIRLGDKVISGKEFRELFALNSTLFTIVSREGGLTLDVKGYGHGVGMSQYGADGMAKQGRSFEEIITHFYKGVEVKPIGQVGI